ncbi:MAG: UDP-forming cellulose synthase catalytic subunit [Merismopedia sp. SIO2A8]|nr:UDP-forming cellulose synthase catalytic subunit [Merismopedia sp. SIO2A8]
MANQSPIPFRRKRQSWFIKGLMQLPLWFDRLLPKTWRRSLFFLILLLLLFSLPLIVTPVTVWQQAIISAVLIAIGFVVVHLEQFQTRRRQSEYLHLFLAWLSIVTTLRYLHYRTSYTLNFDTWVNAIFSIMLYVAELYAIATLLLSYFQTLKQRDRKPVDLSAIPQVQWPSVDIYIPTYNEPVEIVRSTALAALTIDYPAAKKQVYVLDDGRKYPERREKLRAMCEEVSCTMLVRDNNDHAKAGNINTAMRRTKGDLVLILDCDHIPSIQFLQHTVGFFLDPKVALVQTPHWFYNPDPFERNLLTQGRIPVNNELFYKIVQKGNDFWNAAFFCGSAAVVRKDYVLQIGGIAVETVTEDCHTALRLHSLGYHSVYYDKIMVAGLAPDTYSAYVGQQVRWARGMAQILRLENPLFNPKLNLTLPQRLCYVSATSHFFFGFPRLMYALAPVLYLLFGINLIRGIGVETLMYALPHIILAMNANYITQSKVRFSFWNEIFEYAMAFQDGIVTLMALINPRLGSFNVTDKGISVTKRQFDWESSQGTVVMVGLLIVSLIAVPFWLTLRPDAAEAVWINAFWCVFNLILLGAALLVALEQPQMREMHRLQRRLRTTIFGPNDAAWTGTTMDISESGARIELDSWPNLPDVIDLTIYGDFQASVSLNAKIVRVQPSDDDRVIIAVEFIDLTTAQSDDLVLVIYSDVDEWYAQERTERDRPLGSLRFLATSLARAFRTLNPAPSTDVRKTVHLDTQFYWSGQFYPGTATVVSSRSIRVEMPAAALGDPALLKRMRPAVGLVVTVPDEAVSALKLIAQVETAELIDSSDLNSSPEMTALPTAMQPKIIAVELSFPKALDPKQGNKIRLLLQS